MIDTLGLWLCLIGVLLVLMVLRAPPRRVPHVLDHPVGPWVEIEFSLQSQPLMAGKTYWLAVGKIP